MRDEEDGDAEPALEQLELHAHLLTQLRIEVAEGLVQQQQIRLVDERAAEREALHLPAAEQRGRPLLQSREPDELEDARNPLTNFGTLHAAQLQRVGDVRRDGHVRPDRVGLEDHAEVPLVRRDEQPLRGRRDHASS